MANPRPPVKTLIPIYFTFLQFFKHLSYVDFKALNLIGGNVSNFLCTQGIRLVLCKLLSFMAFGGDPRNPLELNTDPVNNFYFFMGDSFYGWIVTERCN